MTWVSDLLVWGVPGSNREVTRSLSAFLSLHLFSVTLGGLCHEPMSFLICSMKMLPTSGDLLQ